MHFNEVPDRKGVSSSVISPVVTSSLDSTSSNDNTTSSVLALGATAIKAGAPELVEGSISAVEDTSFPFQFNDSSAQNKK